MKHNYCVACGTDNNLHQHHLVPRSIGGSDDETNILTLCGVCHAKAHGVQANWRQSELTRKAMQRKKENGEFVGGGPPYGFYCDDGVKLMPDEHEQKTIKLIFELNSNGLSLRKIAAELKNRGLNSRNGRMFQATQINRILASNITP